MARFEDLENAGFRIKYDDAGAPTDIVDSRGESAGFALLKKNKVTGVLINSASPLGLYITNPGALAPIAVELRKAVASEVFITGTGDSLLQMGGDTTNPSSDTRAEKYGFLARLRQKLNGYFGTPDGGQWIPAQASVADTRVANTGCTPVNQWGPFNAYANGSGVIVSRLAMSVAASGDNITFTFTGRYATIEFWESVGNGFNGTITYSIDGGATTQIVGTGLTDTYRTYRIDCLTNAAHTLSLTWVSGKVLATGCTISNGQGIVTRRFGYGGSKASNWTALAEKQQRTSFKTQPASLHILRLGYNDWNNQVGDGLTIDAFKTSVSTLIALAQANTSNKAVLLIGDPPPSTADNKPITYAAFSTALKDLAVGSVAYFDVAAATNATWTAGNDAGLYVDFVHRTEAGYDAEVSVLAAAILDPNLIKSA